MVLYELHRLNNVPSSGRCQVRLHKVLLIPSAVALPASLGAGQH